MATYYEILGAPEEATPEQLKSAFRKAAMREHPDRNRHRLIEAEENTKEINEAWSVLRVPEKRQAYDEFINKPDPDWILGADIFRVEPFHVVEFRKEIKKMRYFEEAERGYNRLAEILKQRKDLAPFMVMAAIEEQLSGAKSSLFETLLRTAPKAVEAFHLKSLAAKTMGESEFAGIRKEIIRRVIEKNPELKGYGKAANATTPSEPGL